MIARIVIIVAAAALLAGCQTTGTGSVRGGECRVFAAPAYAVRGARPYDQQWIDQTVESGVGGCGWRRPQRRPVSLDGQGAAGAPAVAAQRRGVLRRIIRPAPAQNAPAPAPAAPARDAVDDLLSP